MKELTLKRVERHPVSTIGCLSIAGIERTFPICEDVVREPSTRPAGDPAKWVATWKVKSATAIPAGRYRVDWTWSTRFKRNTLQLLDVPGFGGIRIHSGNTEEDTEGCLLPGMTKAAGEVRQSRDAVKMIEGFLLSGGKMREETWITITNKELK